MTTIIQPSLLLEAVQDAARIAGGVAMRHYRSSFVVETKADGSPVSIADREAELAVRDWIAQRFPGDGIEGEEFGVAQTDARRKWIIDPIDGTKTFVRGVPLWGTLIAILEGPDVLAGAIFCPAVDELVAAAPGEGAWWNGTRCSVSTVDRIDRATVLTSSDYQRGEEVRRDAWRDLSNRALVSRTWGDCYGYLLVATGRADIMADPRMAVWDAAPLLPIIEEAGGVFTDWSGVRTVFSGSAIATNAALADETRSLLIAGSPDMLPELDFSKADGLVTVVAQDARSGAVLMVAHADREALERTVATGEMHYRSRTRGLWHKGATSGNVQRLVSLTADCDGDAVLARVIPAGPACHDGSATCFGAGADHLTTDVLMRLDAVIADRAATPALERDASYTRRLLRDRNLRLKKLGEECAELVTACADGDRERAVAEGADLFYHTLVVLRALGVSLDDVRAELARREGPAES